ncbi:hypothetical protein Tco_0782356, partial [Tanacetum coccineum]
GLFSPPKFDLSNSGLEEFQQPKFEGYGPKSSKSVSEDISNEVRKSPDASLVEEVVSNDKSQTPRGNQRNWNNQKSQQLGSDFVMYNKACFVCGSFDHVKANCNYHQRERVVFGNNYTRVNYNYSAKKAHPSAHRNIVPRAVLMKIGLRPHNTARLGHPQKEDQGYVDSGCSRHMTGNMSYLSDFKEFDEIQNQMLDYGYNFMNTKIFIDNESTICIVKNPVFHSKTKHIEIRHHFIRDSNEKKLIQMIKIHTDHNVADLLTKAFDVGRFQYLIASIGMLNP